MFPKSLGKMPLFTSKNQTVSSSASRGISPNALFDFMLNADTDTRLKTEKALKFYSSCSPVATAIDLISQEFSSLKPRIINKNTGEFETNQNHPVLSLLETPNADATYKEYATRLLSFFIITGETYSIATGPVTRPPLEIFVPTVEDITLVANGDDGFLESVNIKSETITESFTRNEVNSRFRYYNSSNDAEIWQIKNYNPFFGRNNLGGLSFLKPIVFEIEQYIESSVHNLSLLKRGARPSGVFSVEELLTDDQFQRAQEQIDGWNSGSQNAGRPLLMEGGAKYQDIIQSARDMDFFNLKKNNAQAIFNHLHIPLALVSPEQMTLANMETAKLSLYDNAVLPFADRVFQELTNFLMPRYPGSENLAITYNAAEIGALEVRRSEVAKMRNAANANTVNEIRQILGEEQRPEGDQILVQSGMRDLASEPASFGLPSSSTSTNDNDETEDEEITQSRAEFFNILTKHLDKDGNRIFSDSELEQLADEYKLD